MPVAPWCSGWLLQPGAQAQSLLWQGARSLSANCGESRQLVASPAKGSSSADGDVSGSSAHSSQRVETGCPRRPLPTAQLKGLSTLCSVPQFPLLRCPASASKEEPSREGARAGAGGAENPVLWLQYRVGQLYTISKHSHQESEKGEGVEVVKNEPHEDPVHGLGQFTEKRVHLSR